MNRQGADKATELQRKIFSRWARQKLLKRQMDVKDVVDDAKDGMLLLNLVEVLSEKSYDGKPVKASKQRVQNIDNVNNVLAFIWASGVQVKIKPSAENVVDGDERAVLGLIWAIMLKFMKIGDDDEGASLNAKDALLMWVQNKTHGYKGVEVTGFNKKSWESGHALCAIIHKHRPQLMNYDALGSDGKANVALAMDAAFKYFELEKYLTVDEFLRLDENSMVVYVSEYYYGIAEQRKLDLAAKRISKVIKLTEENDALRALYVKNATEFKERLTKVEKVLEDRSIDNTMAGAKKRIADFYDYKANDKGLIIQNQLTLEGTYNNLSMRLSHNKRPAYVPPAGVALSDVAAAMKHLEECEQERKVALHAELNRQLRLVEVNRQHTLKYDKVQKWAAPHAAKLATKELIDSVSQATLELRLLDATDKEIADTEATTVASILSMGAELAREKYEYIAAVQEREAKISADLSGLKKASAAKRPVLDDDLLREEFKVRVRLLVHEHEDSYEKIALWVSQKEAYLTKKEDVHSVFEASKQLGFLESYESEKAGVTASGVAGLTKLGAEILAAVYETQYSSWRYEKPEAVKEREATVASKWVILDGLSSNKKAVLDDDLAREQFADHTRMLNQRHSNAHALLLEWVAEKDAYLTKKEVVENVPDAQTALSVLEAYVKENARVVDTNVKALQALGAEVLARKYETKHSSYVFENPSEVTGRETDVSGRLAHLAQLHSAKLATLQDDLAREVEKERLRLEFAKLASAFVNFARDAAEDISIHMFGFTLEEVESYAAVLSQDTARVQGAIAARTNEFTSVHEAMDRMKVVENRYTKLTLTDLAAASDSVSTVIAARQSAYEAELARQRHNDNLCKQFAALADPFSAWINGEKDKITASQADLEAQLEYVVARIAAREAEGAPLAPIRAKQQEIDEAGVTNNRHTTLTARDVDVQFEQYGHFLGEKRKMLETEIENKKLKGLTEQDLKEIEENFKSFDTNKDGVIDKKEFKGALYSLGEERTRAEIDQLMNDNGSNNTMSAAQFREFMINMLGVSDSKEDILAGFSLINKFNPKVADPARMEMVLNAHDLEYLKKTAPKADSGLDYPAWTEDVYSR